MKTLAAFLSLTAATFTAHAQLAPQALKPKPAPAAEPKRIEVPAGPVVPVQTIRYYEGRVQSVTAGGALIHCEFPNYQRNPKGTQQSEIVGTFFLRVGSENLSDDAKIGFYAFEQGTFAYSTFFGGKRVRALTYFAAKEDYSRSPSPDAPGTAPRSKSPTPGLTGTALDRRPDR